MLAMDVRTFDFDGCKDHTIVTEHCIVADLETQQQLLGLRPSHEASTRIFSLQPFDSVTTATSVFQEPMVNYYLSTNL